MGIVAFKDEFQRAIAILPGTLDFPLGEGVLRLSALRELIDSNLKDLEGKHTRSLSSLSHLRRLAKEAVDDDDAATLRYLLDEAMPKIVGAIQDRLAGISANKAFFETFASVIVQAAVENDIPVSAKVTAVRKDVTELFERHIAVLGDIRDHAMALEWDFDPEAHGGPTFDAADELLSHLSH